MNAKFKSFCKSLLTTICLVGLLLFSSVGTLTPAAVAASDQVQLYVDNLLPLRDRIPELESLIEKQNWNGVQTFLRGPLGELGVRLSRLEKVLPSSEQSVFNRSSRLLQDHLHQLDVAASKKNIKAAAAAYEAVVQDFAQIL
ncbi:MAG: photosystem II protein PsbQ [Thermosynechococcaceae cyanobacterium]